MYKYENLNLKVIIKEHFSDYKFLNVKQEEFKSWNHINYCPICKSNKLRVISEAKEFMVVKL